MAKQINLDWAQQFMSNNFNNSEQDKHVEWIGKDDYKKMIKFKILPANSQENDHLGGAVLTAKHWSVGVNKDQSMLCVEKMFPDKHVECPICKLRRELIKAGFTDEELCVAGKFGPTNLFEARQQSCIKVVVMDSDLKSGMWDQKHISVLQMNGNYLIKWLVDRYLDKDVADFLDVYNGNIIKFSRRDEFGKWDREILDSAIKWEVSDEDKQKVLEENENLTLNELWKFPSDDEFLHMKQVCEEWKESLLKAKKDQSSTIEDLTELVTNPF